MHACLGLTIYILCTNLLYSVEVRVLNIPHPTISSNEHLKIHWHKFGKSLGFNVQNIEGKHSEIFKVWLERNPNATYDKLVSDLSVIGDHKGARTVCRKFGMLYYGMCVTIHLSLLVW